MRKIEQAMINAISYGAQGSHKCGNNTEVEVTYEMTRVHLHGHNIAKCDQRGAWSFNLCGWNTPTTRSRINALAREFGRAGVRNVQGVPITGQPSGQPAPLNGWF